MPSASTSARPEHLQLNTLAMGIGEVVMTPTTEEWTLLGCLPSDMTKFNDDDLTPAPGPEDEEISDHSSDSARTQSSPVLLQPRPVPISPDSPFPSAFLPTDVEPTLALPTLTSVNGIIHSATAPASRPILSSLSLGTPPSPTQLLTSLLPPIRTCSLKNGLAQVRKPIDPKTYSSQTKHRSITSFSILNEAGKGAYGVVKTASEITSSPDHQSEPVIIKYIIKQRILADCWRKHKVLGPIPIEIHVLDHLRRIVSRPPIVPILSSTTTTTTTTNPQEEIHQTIKTGHTNICGILDYFEDTDYYYLIMPYFGQGQDLFSYIEKYPSGLPKPSLVKIISQILDAVCFLHEHNIVHRDIKDENVILDDDLNIQLIDFGSAAYVREGSKGFDTFSGTLDFAAPEVLRGEKHQGKSIDIWALGVLLYVLTTGECPFWNADEASKSLQPNTRSFLNLKETKKDQDLIDVIKTCLEIDPNDRSSAHQIANMHLFSSSTSTT